MVRRCRFFRLPFFDSTHARRVDVGDTVGTERDARARVVRARFAAGGRAREGVVDDGRIVWRRRARVANRVQRGSLSTPTRRARLSADENNVSYTVLHAHVTLVRT